MSIKLISTFLSLILAFSSAIAGQTNSTSLAKEREQVVKQYVLDLQTADYQGISNLFDEQGVVISTSRGKVNAHDFFYSFLPEIDSASTELHGIFLHTSDSSHYAARFHFSFHLKDGESGEGEYIDEFIFATNSSKLQVVSMFENLKFENSIK